jgi:hypothetical protein
MINSKENRYRSIFFRKSLVCKKMLHDCMYCCAEISVKDFDKSVNKSDFLKIIKLYVVATGSV